MASERREFLAQLSALGASLALAPSLSCLNARAADLKPAFGQQQLTRLRALCEVILPSDGEPGAVEAGCADFIELQMRLPQFSMLKQVLERGLLAMDSLARGRHQSSLESLNLQQRDALLRTLVEQKKRGFDGNRFLRLLLVLTLEGLFCDPKHGGNRNGIGWRLIGHKPVHWAPADDRVWQKREL